MDSLRELRSLHMVLFPCPPIPILCTRGDTLVKTNSHDLLAMLVNVAIQRNKESENTIRAEKQAALTDTFFDGKYENIELKMQTFTRDWLLTYSDGVRDLRFLPLDDTTPKIREQAQAWLAAQLILGGEESKAEDFKHTPISEWYRKCYIEKMKVNVMEI